MVLKHAFLELIRPICFPLTVFRTGTDEEYNEKNQLLQEIKDLKATSSCNPSQLSSKRSKILNSTAEAMDVRLASMRALNRKFLAP